MRLMALLAGAALLGACSSEPEVDVRNASVEEVVREVADARGGRDVTMRPGKWQTKVTVEDIAIPGMPASAAAFTKPAARTLMANLGLVRPPPGAAAMRERITRDMALNRVLMRRAGIELE